MLPFTELMFLPLFFTISVPGDPRQLGFEVFQFTGPNTIKTNWKEFYRVVGLKAAIRYMNEYWMYLQKDKAYLWLEQNEIKLNGSTASVSINRIYAKFDKKNPAPKASKSVWSKTKSFFGIK